MENRSSGAEVLGWYNLTDHDVYTIASLENEARDAASGLMSDTPMNVETAMSILVNHEIRAASWLADQAAIRGLACSARTPVSDGEPAQAFSDWLSDRIDTAHGSLRGISTAAGVSVSHVSDIRTGRRPYPSREVVLKIAGALARDRGLDEVSGAAFVLGALVRANHL